MKTYQNIWIFLESFLIKFNQCISFLLDCVTYILTLFASLYYTVMHSFIAVIAPVAAILLANIAVLSIVMYKLHQGIQARSQDLCKS